MKLRVRLRYKSTSDFGKGDHLSYDKSLAHALEWLYDEDQFEDECTWHYCMEGVLPIYIMMSIVTDFFVYALQDYAEANIRDYILRMEDGNYKHGWNDNRPSLLYLDDEIIIGSVRSSTSEVILWATYLYASFRANMENDNIKFRKAKDVLYKLFVKKTGMKEEFVNETFLMKHFDQTTRDFVSDIIRRSKDDKPVHDNKPQQTPVINKMEESVLDKITTNNWCFYYEGWRNGKKGGFVQNQGIYRFREMVRNKGGNLVGVHDKEEDNPIVAVGIVAHWLIFSGKKVNVIKRLTKYEDGIPKDIRELFENYTEARFEQFKNEHRDDPSTWNWNWDYVFFAKYIIPNEICFNKTTEKLFEYLPEEDIRLVRSVMDNYIEYLKQTRLDKGYNVPDELKVLRSLKTNDELMLEDLNDSESSTILESLERNGYIRFVMEEDEKYYKIEFQDNFKVLLRQLENDVRNKVPSPSAFYEKAKDTDSISTKDEKTPSNPDNTEKLIDIEILKEYFRISFQRNGFESLISLLKTKHDAKGYAMIAYQIYLSKHFRRGDFNTFSAWYRTFCEIVGCEYCASYKPSKLKPSREQEVSFFFLK